MSRGDLLVTVLGIRSRYSVFGPGPGTVSVRIRHALGTGTEYRGPNTGGRMPEPNCFENNFQNDEKFRISIFW